jgi:hypothetical protein
MDSFLLDPMSLNDPSEVPLPPQLVRIREVNVTPWPDGRRIRVYLEVDPFQKRPSAEVTILGATGKRYAEASIIETAIRKMEFNMHLRHAETAGDYSLRVVLFYEDRPMLEQQPVDQSSAPAEAPVSEEVIRLVVDDRNVPFTIS